MLFFIIALVLTGLIVGALARLALPGPDPMSLGQTIVIGISGSIVAGIIGRLLFGGGGSLILAVICSAGFVYLVRRTHGHNIGGATASRWR